ncbi:protein-S-isoprenylcysteine O-methyltransferase, partial [Brucella abortus]|nr:protein-S-isoprenylcysteine O-methyltransferase [Brucella abortus]
PLIAFIVWSIGLVAWVVIRIPHQRRARKIKVARTARTLADRLALGAATVGLSVVPLALCGDGLSKIRRLHIPALDGRIGIASSNCFFSWLFYASHKQLGKNWSVSLDIRREHKLVTDGLYRYVRHPMYLSFWLWAIAQFFLLPNWIAGLAGLRGCDSLFLSDQT